MFSDHGLTIVELYTEEKPLGENDIFESMIYVNATVKEEASADQWEALSDLVQDIYHNGYQYATLLTVNDGNGKRWGASDAGASGFPTSSEKTSEEKSAAPGGAGQVARQNTPIWDRTRASLMESIEYDMAGQLIYDNIFTLEDIPGDNGETLYSVVMDTFNTGTGFSFLTDPDTGRKNLTLIAVDFTNPADGKAFAIGAAAMLLEGDIDGVHR